MTRRQHKGFTLIELLVAMSLLSVIMAGLVSALRSMAQTEVKIDQRLQQLDEMRVARAFLQQVLTRVNAATVDAPGATGKRVVSFAAGPASLIWVGIFPARPDLGGRHYFRLAMESSGDASELVLRFFPWNPDMVYPDWSTAQARILLPGVQQFSVQAKGLAPEGRNPSEPWPAGWQNGWPVPDVLPEQVRVRLSDAHGAWPDWIVTLSPLPQSDESFSVVVVGGSRR